MCKCAQDMGVPVPSRPPVGQVKRAGPGVGMANDVQREEPPVQLAGAQRERAAVVHTQPPPPAVWAGGLDLRTGRAEGEEGGNTCQGEGGSLRVEAALVCLAK